MRISFIKSSVTCLVVLILILGSASVAFADDGVYLGISYANNDPGRGFNDDTYYSQNGYRIGAPILDTGAGFTLTGGIMVDPIALELSYTNSSHSGSTHVGTYNWDGTASFNEIDFNMKLFFGQDSSFKPYGLIGFGFPWMVIKNGEHNAATDSVTGNCTYTGISFNLGGGLDFEVADQLTIKGELLYRLAGYTSGLGSNVAGELSDSIDGSGLCFTIGINYTVTPF